MHTGGNIELNSISPTRLPWLRDTMVTLAASPPCGGNPFRRKAYARSRG
jgi:hypothetical protein